MWGALEETHACYDACVAELMEGVAAGRAEVRSSGDITGSAMWILCVCWGLRVLGFDRAEVGRGGGVEGWVCGSWSWSWS